MPRKNYLKIPRHVRHRITTLAVDDVVVACVKRLTLDDISQYAHLGLAVKNGQLELPSPAVPPASQGRYSNINVNGKEIIRKDLPMVTKSFATEAPNWHKSGTHTVWWERDVYERDFIPPKHLTLSTELLEAKPDGSSFAVKFSIDQLLNRTAQDFDDDLLYNLNILQENVGAINVFAATTSHADYMDAVRVTWEILPPGNIDVVLKRLLEKKHQISEKQQAEIRSRVNVLERLKPLKYIAGTSGFSRYFGAMFEDDLVVFENVNYGNAIYVMYQNWEALSKRSRVDLLKGPRDDFKRIEHRSAWEAELKDAINEHRKGK